MDQEALAAALEAAIANLPDHLRADLKARQAPAADDAPDPPPADDPSGLDALDPDDADDAPDPDEFDRFFDDPTNTEGDWLDDYEAVATRGRRGGFSAQRQYDFLLALSESGCVAEACRRVAVSQTAAYNFRRRADADQFRRAWDAALDHAVARIADGAFSRALHGTVRPVFYKGEQVGERRYFDERLTMFILRTRAAHQYGKWIDSQIATEAPDGPTARAEHFARTAHEDALTDDLGLAHKRRDPLPHHRFDDDPPME